LVEHLNKNKTALHDQLFIPGCDGIDLEIAMQYNDAVRNRFSRLQQYQHVKVNHLIGFKSA
jgi:hypothetical protein